MAEYYKEGFLIQLILYSLVWIVSEYTGLLVCVIMAGVLLAIWVFAIIIEMVEKSKVPSAYFRWLFLSALAPALVAVAFSIMFEGNFNWVE